MMTEQIILFNGTDNDADDDNSLKCKPFEFMVISYQEECWQSINIMFAEMLSEHFNGN